MFSWDFKWLWAQCLVISAGMFLLGYLALPPAKNLVRVTGKVEQVGLTSRKGLGGVWRLVLATPNGGENEVLIDWRAVPEQTARALVGKDIAVDVNWSSKAVTFESASDEGIIAENVRRLAAEGRAHYDMGGAAALALGIFLGFAGLIFKMRPD